MKNTTTIYHQILLRWSYDEKSSSPSFLKTTIEALKSLFSDVADESKELLKGHYLIIDTRIDVSSASAVKIINEFKAVLDSSNSFEMYLLMYLQRSLFWSLWGRHQTWLISYCILSDTILIDSLLTNSVHLEAIDLDLGT